jgi:hypothetical protein
MPPLFTSSPHHSPVFFCQIKRGEKAFSDGSSFCVVSPLLVPSLLLVSVYAPRMGLGSQVAAKLSVEKTIEFFFTRLHSLPHNGEGADLLGVLEEVILKVNEVVYRFGHQLAAGGRCATTLLATLIEPQRASVARVGSGQVFVVRKGRAYPFFEKRSSSLEGLQPYGAQPLLGSHAEVMVELSSVQLTSGDGILGCHHQVELREEVLALFYDTFGNRWHHTFPLEGLLPHLVEKPIKLPFSCLVTLPE